MLKRIIMRIGIVSDGKYGQRAYEQIGKKFQVEWIVVPFPASPVVDDIDLTVPLCDFYISYARHPDVALALIEKMRPVILGISFGPGFLRQARAINEWVIAPLTMCSLDDTTGIREIDEYARAFGRPRMDIQIDNDSITRITLHRESPCGSTRGAAADITGQPLSKATLEHFGLRICHFCMAPRFGHTCDKEISGLLHIRELIHAAYPSSQFIPEPLRAFSEEIERLYEKQTAQKNL
jgi:hypothetical protein